MPQRVGTQTARSTELPFVARFVMRRQPAQQTIAEFPGTWISDGRRRSGTVPVPQDPTLEKEQTYVTCHSSQEEVRSRNQIAAGKRSRQTRTPLLLSLLPLLPLLVAHAANREAVPRVHPAGSLPDFKTLRVAGSDGCSGPDLLLRASLSVAARPPRRLLSRYTRTDWRPS